MNTFIDRLTPHTGPSGDLARAAAGRDTAPHGRLVRAVRGVARFLTPRWLLLHVIVLALAVTMVLLGRWQLDVSNTRHFDLQNFSYAFQWWLFTAAGLFIWWRIICHALHPPAVPEAGSEIVAVVRAAGTGVARLGPAELVTTGHDGSPVVYRGYAIPNSAQTPARSGGDDYHGAYNDYLWQLALADGADRPHGPLAGPQPQPQADPAPREVPATPPRESAEDG